MPAGKLKAHLDFCGVKYVSLQHSPAFTAQEIAESAHITGSDFAKTVIVRTNDGLAMVVLPANRKISLPDLRQMLRSDHLELATEAEFSPHFPDCEPGAMPPFGNLYGLPVYFAESLYDEPEIAFNAGTHREVIKLALDDYVRLVNPMVVDLITT